MTGLGLLFCAWSAGCSPPSFPAKGADTAGRTLAAAGVPEAARLKLAKHLAALDAPGFDYPWEGLEAAVARQPGGKLRLMGYGSLLNRDSAARTIPDTPREGHPPVLALGARRVFNYLIPEARLKSYGGNFGPRECAALNLDYTGSAGDALNGRLLVVAPADFAALRQREFGYDLRPVACLPWGDWSAEPFTAYVLVAPAGERNGRRVVDDAALPHPLYAQVCRKGAAAVSAEFLALYLDTTFLADRRTSLRAWEKLHPEVAGSPEAPP